MKERSADLAFRRLLEKNYIKMKLEKVVDAEKEIIHFRLVEIEGIKVTDL